MQIDTNINGVELPGDHPLAETLSNDEQALLCSAAQVAEKSIEEVKRLDLEEDTELNNINSLDKLSSGEPPEPVTRMRDALTLASLIEEVAEARENKTKQAEK